MAVSTRKGLMSLYGMGFLYARPELAERMKPIFLSRFGVAQQVWCGATGTPKAWVQYGVLTWVYIIS